MNENDINLIRAARSGDTSAFGEIVHNYKDYVYRTVFHMVRNQHDAEDIAQEVFVKVYKSLKRLQDERAFPAWIAQIATRTALDWLRLRNRYQVTDLDEENHQFPLPSTASNSTLEVEEALGKLSEEHRVVTILRAVYGFEYEEIAGILKIPIGTVRSRLHNARMQIRGYLKDERGDGR